MSFPQQSLKNGVSDADDTSKPTAPPSAAAPAAAAPAAPAAAAPDPAHPLTDISELGPNDVLMGRGGGINNRSGNIKFRQLVKQYKVRYISARKVDKPKIAVKVVKFWRGLSPPGRFIEPTPGTDLYHDIGDKKAQLKASQCLRERTPDVQKLCKEVQSNKERAELTGNISDVLVSVVSGGLPMPLTNQILHWAKNDESLQSTRNIEFRSLHTSKAYRIVPLYFLQGEYANCCRRAIQRRPTDSMFADIDVEYLALLQEIKSSEVGDKIGKWDVKSFLQRRLSWVLSKANGRVDVSPLVDEEKAHIRKIIPLIIPGDPSVVLPLPSEV